jgi:hypothetical protein
LPCCGSGTLIPDPTTAPKEGDIKTFCPTIFSIHKYHKIVSNFFFEQVNTFFLAKTLRIIVLFTQNFVIKLSKIWFLDPEKTYPGSGKNLFRKKPIPDPGSKRHRIPDPSSESATLLICTLAAGLSGTTNNT